MEDRKKLLSKDRDYAATLLYLANEKQLDIDGFGFFSKSGSSYCIYVHTGEYALKDGNGKIYLFPDCKVGVWTSEVSNTYVLNKYKHPFLPDYDDNQKICMGSASLNSSFSAGNVISALETGISTIKHGYFTGSHFGGYHNLSGSYHHSRRNDNVSFRDYKISNNHPKIKSGEVEITNNCL